MSAQMDAPGVNRDTPSLQLRRVEQHGTLDVGSSVMPLCETSPSLFHALFLKDQQVPQLLFRIVQQCPFAFDDCLVFSWQKRRKAAQTTDRKSVV